MAKTKIVVIQLKEIIYTVIFAALGILLILLLIFMFTSGKGDDMADANTTLYKAGKWTSSISLLDTAINLEVIVDKDHINAVNIKNIDESITVMFPLIEPSLDAIEAQLVNDVPIDQVELKKDSKYTQQLLLEGIKVALDKAKVAD